MGEEEEEMNHTSGAWFDMKAALEWYEEKVRGCIGMAPEAEEARYALSVDAGERARLALEKARGEK
jgi:hypothetical protein